MAILKPKKTEAKINTTKKVVENLNYKSVAELLEAAKKLKQEISVHRLAARSGKEKNTRKGFVMRKTLARTLTALSAKKFEVNSEAKV